mmetsp:Transcript_19416/g.28777  ORF Transcript_19416/g.28777 Transcript_19416/m.28777 type:complete len:274 (+) Transcript_19416:18-839(+)
MKRPATEIDVRNFDRTTFPYRLHRLLSQAVELGQDDIISWHPSGSKFIIHKQTEFIAKVLPNTFKQTKFASFRRQINAYKFEREPQQKNPTNITATNIVYSHPNFHRDYPQGCEKIVRRRAKEINISYSDANTSYNDLYPHSGGYGMKAIGVNSYQQQETLASFPEFKKLIRPGSVASSSASYEVLTNAQFLLEPVVTDNDLKPCPDPDVCGGSCSDKVLDELVANTLDNNLSDDKFASADQISWDPSEESLSSINNNLSRVQSGELPSLFQL